MLDIKVTKTTAPKAKPDEKHLGFGNHYTDHMFIMDYTEGRGWHSPRIEPYHSLELDPAALVFHYAQECFEGMKAYRAADGRVLLFRPEKNAARMQSTHRRLCIPEIPVEDFVQAVKALVGVDKDWVPGEPDTSLYLRPFTIATEAHLGVKPSASYQFIIIASPSGAYYAEGMNPVKIYVEDEYVRATPGGTGYIKCGGNYAASLIGQMKAHDLGYSQVLWLDGVERKYVEEVGSMNCFFKIDGVIRTAPCVGTVLPGITRMSCIELLEKWGYKVDCESRLPIADVIRAGKEGKLEEVFGTGTAAVISPVGELRYEDEVLTIKELKKSFDGRTLFDHVNLEVIGGERIALLGDNGTGKSTLLKILLGEEEPDSGKLRMGPTVKVGYLPQIIRFSHPERNLVDTMIYDQDCSTQTARNRLAAFNFRGEDVFKPVSALSGGEQSRLRLCMLMDEKINLLILDEPTNHLDVASREWIEEAVESYEGNLLFVSHDRYFINRFATRIWMLENGQIIDFRGTFEEYRAAQERKRLQAAVLVKAEPEKPKKEKPRRPGGTKELEKQVAAAERAVAKAEERQYELTLKAEEVASNYLELQKVYDEQKALEEEIAALYTKWETLAAELEEARG